MGYLTDLFDILLQIFKLITAFSHASPLPREAISAARDSHRRFLARAYVEVDRRRVKVVIASTDGIGV